VIRVLIADDHKIVRQGLRFLLSQESGIEVAGEAADGPAALEAVRALRPDVVLLDLFMPGLDGIAVLKALQAGGLASGVLVLTSSQDDAHLVQAIRAGALSYLPKTADVDQVVASVRAAARGESVLQPAATARLLRELRRGSAADPLGRLTPRERDVLTEVARGRSNREIARALSVSDETVKATSLASWPSSASPTGPRQPSSGCSANSSRSMKRSTRNLVRRPARRPGRSLTGQSGQVISGCRDQRSFDARADLPVVPDRGIEGKQALDGPGHMPAGTRPRWRPRPS
jgi:NarL family two-component system response regulator LiaR